ncbi:hypothetical protein ADK66_00285 [Micromonospora sp. NRRL B-16802]|nr:hypothetical protein ADK66_00285 [Micromonospora sp. NRRL B-16802]
MRSHGGSNRLLIGRNTSPPVGVEWPDGMTYLAKLDLSAIPAGSHDINLPSDGHLLLFSELRSAAALRPVT